MKKKILLIVGLVVLVGGAAAGGMFLGRQQSAKTPPADPATVADELKADATSEEGGHGGEAKGKEGKEGAHGEAGEKSPSRTDLTYEFDKFTTNLSDDLSTYVQMKVELEAASPEGKQVIEANLAPLRDATIMLISGKTREEIQSTAGKERLKRELLVRYQGVLNSGKLLRNLYITEFAVVRY